MDKNAALKIISSFKNILESRWTKVDKLILFGSYATGQYKEDSDIDLVVISRDFENKIYWERIDILSEAIYDIFEPIEATAFTPPQEWRRNVKDKKASADEDMIKMLSISDYLKELEHNLKPTQDNRCPTHVILTFVKQVEFAQHSDEKLSEIRERYNSLSLKIHVMENFLAIQGDPAKIDQVGTNQTSVTHKELRRDVL